MKFVRNFLDALGRPDLIALCDGPPGLRQLPVRQFLDETFRARTQAQWIEFCAPLDMGFAPVNDLRQGFDLPHVQQRGMRLVDERGWEHIGTPLKFRSEPGALSFAAPAHGEHTRHVLNELGFTGEEIEAMIAAGAVGAPPPS